MNILRDLFNSIDSMDKEANKSRDCDQQISEGLDYSDNSEYVQDYLRMLQIKGKSEISSILSNSIQGFDTEIKYDNNSEFQHRIQISITRYTQNYEYVNVSVRLGYFYFPKITLVYIDTKNFCKQSMLIGQGSFCHVYRCKFKGNLLAFKCFNRRGGLKDQLFEVIIKEYCIFLIASHIQVAPKAVKLYGFDIVVYQDFVQFGMQCCEKVRSNKQNFQKIEKDLKENLLAMHSFNLIHYDIKIENVGYSPNLKKFVYLDFGLSEIIFKSLGTKINMFFKGTPNYCSSQMANLERTGKKGYIDPFYNDLCCYKQTVNFLRIESEHFNEIDNGKSQTKDQIQDVTQRYYLYELKYLVFEHKVKQIQAIICQNNLSYQQLMILLEFSQRLKTSLIKHKITIMIAKKISAIDNQKRKYLHILEDNEKNQKDELAPKTMRDFLTKVLPNHLSSYYLKKLELQQSSQVYQYLTNAQIRKGQKDIQYFEVLSRCFKFNALLFNEKQIISICNSFAQTYGHNLKNLSINPKCTIQNKIFAQICLFLFQFSLENLTKKQYYHIFIDILTNIIACKIISLNQIINMYEKILNFSLNFQKLVKIVLQFNCSFVWIRYEYHSWIEYSEFYMKIQKRNRIFLQQSCSQSEYNQQQKKILQILLFKDTNNQNIQIQSSKCFLSPKIVNDIKIFQLHKSFCDRAKLSSKQFVRFKECISQSQYFDNNHFDYYHFRLILYYFESNDSQSAFSIIKQYQKSMIIRKSDGFMIVIQKIVQFEKMNEKIADFNYITKLSQQTLQLGIPLLCNYLYKRLIMAFINDKPRINISKNEDRKFMMKIRQILESIINFCMCLHKIQIKTKLDTIHNRLMIQNHYEKVGLAKNQSMQEKRSIYYLLYKNLDHIRIDLSKKQVIPYGIKKLLLLAYILFSIGKQAKSLELQQKIIRLSCFNNRTGIYVLQYITFTLPLDEKLAQKIMKKRFMLYFSLVNQIQFIEILFHRINFLEKIALILRDQNKDGLIQLLKRMANILKIYNNKQNFESICIFTRNFTLLSISAQKSFIIIDIIKSMQLCSNQYEFIYLFYIFLFTKIIPFDWIYIKFLRIATSLSIQSCLFFTSQLYLSYNGFYSKKIHPRKAIFLSKSILRFRMFRIDRDTTQKLMIDQPHLSIFKYSHNIEKFRCIQKKIPSQGRNYYQIDLLDNLLLQNQKAKSWS